MKGHTVIAKEVERPSGGNVVDLMEALKRSVEGSTSGKGKAKPGRGGKKRA
jgi:DNA end-binding protein Ku